MAELPGALLASLGLEFGRVAYKASMFSRHPRAERSRAASLPLTRLDRTEPQMKRSSRATPGGEGVALP